MILIDLNQVLLSGLMVQIANEKVIKEDLVRHLALNTLRGHVKNFKGEYGEVVLCCDNRTYWRREVFPFYKANRKKAREKSDLDWHLIFDILSKLKVELKENFPYKVIDVDNAEADDIIGTLAPRAVAHENVLIISSDNDFLQLQKWNSKSDKYTIKQYNPAKKAYLKSENPLLDLKEKIIRGDKGDGIPNCLSSSDCFVTDKKQKAVTKGIFTKLINEDVTNWTDENAKIGYSRNELLINLDKIPSDVKDRIVEAYENTKAAPRMKLLNYFIEKKLKNLVEVLGDF
jgi:5'-3' exonuclease, N-terminal resolvase-like domain/T4 RNase H, C terminal